MTDRELMQMALDALEKHVLEYETTEALRARLSAPEPEPVVLAWDEVFDAAAAAYCRSEASRKALRLCFQTRQQTTQVSIGWTANELMAFAKTVAYVCATEPQRNEPEPVAWHEPGAYGNVTVYKKWAEENKWLPLYKGKNE